MGEDAGLEALEGGGGEALPPRLRRKRSWLMPPRSSVLLLLLLLRLLQQLATRRIRGAAASLVGLEVECMMRSNRAVRATWWCL